jgi:hypothetical protein
LRRDRTEVSAINQSSASCDAAELLIAPAAKWLKVRFETQRAYAHRWLSERIKSKSVDGRG